MKHRKFEGLLFVALLATVWCQVSISAKPLPAWFEANTGQLEPAVRFFSSGGSGTVFVKDEEVMFATRTASLRIRFIGASVVRAQGVQETGIPGSRLVRNNRSRWSHEVRLFAKVSSRDVYPGIDVVHHLTDGREPEFDFTIAAGADPRSIRLRYEGGGHPRLDVNGNLVFQNGVRQARPVAYQRTPQGLATVDVAYSLAPDGDVSFTLGRYDRMLPLVIDPVLFSGYVGGDRDDKPTAVVRDASGNVWITGSSTSLVIAGNEPIQTENQGGRDVFLARLSPVAGGRLSVTYWTVIGGSGDDEATAIALDTLGMICVVGQTDSPDFPQAGSALQDEENDTTDSDEEVYGGGVDAFVLRIDPNVPGTAGLRYSRIYGGLGTDVASAIAVDAQSAMYIVGHTTSDKIAGIVEEQSLLTTRRGGSDAFLIKVVPDSEAPLVYATYLGGSGTEDVAAVALAGENEVYLTGYTTSDDFPVTFDAYESTRRSIFLTRLNISKPWLDALEYATYLGSGGYDRVRSMALDADGKIWLAGYTSSSNFPITFDGYQISTRGGADGFALRFDYEARSTATAIGYSTYAGGSDDDIVYAMTTLPGGRIAIAGYTYSKDYPLADAPGETATPAMRPSGAFATIIEPARIADQALIYSAVFDGALADVATALVPDGHNLLICGYTTSFDLPVTDGSGKPGPGGSRSLFVVGAGPNPNDSENE